MKQSQDHLQPGNDETKKPRGYSFLSRLAKHLPMFIFHFSNTFPMHLIHSSMFDSESLIIEVILQLSKQMRRNTRMDIFVYF